MDKRRMVLTLLAGPLIVLASACGDSGLSEPTPAVAQWDLDPLPEVQGGCLRLQADDTHDDAVWDESSCSSIGDFNGETFASALLSDSMWSIPFGDSTYALGTTKQLVYFVKAQYIFADSTGTYDASLSRSEVLAAVFANLTECGGSVSCPRAFPAIEFATELPAAAIAVEFVGFPGMCSISFVDPVACAMSLEHGNTASNHDEPRLCLTNSAYTGPVLCTQDDLLESSGDYLAPRVGATLTPTNLVRYIDCPPSPEPCAPSGHICLVDAGQTHNRTSESLTFTITYNGYSESTSSTQMTAYNPAGFGCPSLVLTATTSSGHMAYRYFW